MNELQKEQLIQISLLSDINDWMTEFVDKLNLTAEADIIDIIKTSKWKKEMYRRIQESWVDELKMRLNMYFQSLAEYLLTKEDEWEQNQ